MRQFFAGLSLAALLTTGCSSAPGMRNQDVPVAHAAPAPTVPQLVTYLNDNARRVQAIQCNHVALDCEQGMQRVGIDCVMACQKPRNFRLKGKAIGQSVLDIGSNNDEFWYWISKADPPYVYHCAYQDYPRAANRMPFPFQPEMVVAALGIAEYEPNTPYEVKEYKNYIELIEQVPSPHNPAEKLQKVVVFNRMQAAPGHPQVVAHLLRDPRGKIICQAVVREVQVNRETNAVLPRRIVLTWPSQKAKMDMQMFDTQVTAITPDRAQRLFQRADLASLTSFDLGRWVIDSPNSGLQRASSPPR